MLNHVSLGTNDAARAAPSTIPSSPPSASACLHEHDGSIDYGTSIIAFSLEKPTAANPASVGNGVHVACPAESRAMVDAFHRAALANGGSDAGAPGLRSEYDANYYGAFVRDPDGDKIEAVTFAAP